MMKEKIIIDLDGMDEETRETLTNFLGNQRIKFNVDARGKFIVVRVLDDDDFENMVTKGTCISCKYNLGPTLPGGTRNEAQGAICSNKAFIDSQREHSDIGDDETILVYRIEVITDGEFCKHWELGVDTPTLYGILKVDPEKTDKCPYCETVLDPSDGCSLMGDNGLVSIAGGYCDKFYYYVYEEAVSHD